ncbi:hypothetical protein N0V84_000274 [Fusarium piperis]|uniref:Uncharacterized protein n=1 Tax=Fusarium piperis TaxID=1435070 RepID=A0A9W9BUB9_9HYPO|nr:hypothetical protein N0V84_000274 [Fusarium piperis]
MSLLYADSDTAPFLVDSDTFLFDVNSEISLPDVDSDRPLLSVDSFRPIFDVEYDGGDDDFAMNTCGNEGSDIAKANTIICGYLSNANDDDDNDNDGSDDDNNGPDLAVDASSNGGQVVEGLRLSYTATNLMMITMALAFLWVLLVMGDPEGVLLTPGSSQCRIPDVPPRPRAWRMPTTATISVGPDHPRYGLYLLILRIINQYYDELDSEGKSNMVVKIKSQVKRARDAFYAGGYDGNGWHWSGILPDRAELMLPRFVIPYDAMDGTIAAMLGDMRRLRMLYIDCWEFRNNLVTVNIFGSRKGQIGKIYMVWRDIGFGLEEPTKKHGVLGVTSSN